MIARDALYTFIESLIGDSEPDKALHDAVSARNLRTTVNQPTNKIVRVDCFAGNLNVPGVDGEMFRETNVQSIIQSIVTPDMNSGLSEEDAVDEAKDISFAMTREIFDAIAADRHLGGLVCNSNFDEFETGEANLGAQKRGVTYLDGIINNAQEG